MTRLPAGGDLATGIVASGDYIAFVDISDNYLLKKTAVTDLIDAAGSQATQTITTLSTTTIQGISDADTTIVYGDDSIVASAGGVEFLRAVESTQDALTFNNGAVDLDFTAKKLTSGSWINYDAGTDALTVGGTTSSAAGTWDFTLAPKVDAVTMSPQKWVDVTVTAALLDSAGTVNVIAGVAGDQYKIRNIRLVGGGTNFGAGGDRLISLTDGTTVWTTIANADIESAPAATLEWGNTKVPFLTGTSDTASASNAAIRFQYSGGTTDHSGTGSIKFSVCIEKVA